MALKRWQDWVNVILGLWMVISPLMLGFFTGAGAAARSAWILGGAVVIFATIATRIPKAWEEALNIILGVCLIASPWALGFTDQTVPTTNAVVVGLLVTAFGLWAMLADTDVQRWWRERHGTPR